MREVVQALGLPWKWPSKVLRAIMGQHCHHVHSEQPEEIATLILWSVTITTFTAPRKPCLRQGTMAHWSLGLNRNLFFLFLYSSQFKHISKKPAFLIRVLAQILSILLSVHLTAGVPRQAGMVAQLLGPLTPKWETRLEFWDPSPSLAQPGHLGSESVNGRSIYLSQSLFLSPYHPTFQINIFDNKLISRQRYCTALRAKVLLIAKIASFINLLWRPQETSVSMEHLGHLELVRTKLVHSPSL